VEITAYALKINRARPGARPPIKSTDVTVGSVIE
jgi:hypothetical protein